MTAGSAVAAAHPWHGAGHRQGPGTFMFGRPPHALSVQVGQLPNGTLPRRRGSTGTPDAARFSAVCCGESAGCVMLGYLQFLDGCWLARATAHLWREGRSSLA